MRLEKGYLHWKADILTEFDPFETGLARFVSLDKPDFVGKAALVERNGLGVQRRLVTMQVSCTDRAAHPSSSVMAGPRVVGTVTSGGWGHRTGLNLALGFVEAGMSPPAPRCGSTCWASRVPRR